ncbi:MAG TPA: hypothetical protein VKX49_03940 [Bryobacteraceae bacterium]|nr:hypothetical protein [Bryobacteraceae bacterium]
MRRQPARFLLAAEAWWSRIAAHRSRVVFAIALVSLGARAALLPVLPIPKPAIQDEFSYLLAADTFAHGRLANPTPALPEHFETLQVLMHPAYASKYPPFSGLVMALGQRVAGEPWWGVWFSAGVLCGAICWALQGWLPAGWALAGSVIALLKIGIVSYWSESYWGGTCAAIGGALVIGAIPRLLERPQAATAVAFACGLAILANTRPYEGLVLALACAVYLAHGFWRSRENWAQLVRRVMTPTAVVLIAVGGWMGYYNYRVTGNPLEMPYLEHERQYALWSSLFWPAHAKPKPPYSNAFLEDFWTHADAHDKLDAREHALKTHAFDLYRLARFFWGLPLTLFVLLCGRALWRDRVGRAGLILLAGFYAGVAFNLRLFPHYAAPATALVYLLGACALRTARHSWPGSGEERIYIGWGVAAVFALVSLGSLLTADNRCLFGPIDYHVRAEWGSVMQRLHEIPGDHLILVRYGPQHEPYQELVYNGADIAHSHVIWARSISPDTDEKLIDYYRGRRVWSLSENGDLVLKDYTPGEEKGPITTEVRFRGSGRF